MLEINKKIFATLQDYLKWLEQEWNTFLFPLYTLENYLAMGEFVWETEKET